MAPLDLDVTRMHGSHPAYRTDGTVQIVRYVARVQLISAHIRRTFTAPTGSSWQLFRVDHFLMTDSGDVEAYAVRHTLDGKPTVRYSQIRMCEPHTYGPVIFDLIQECVRLATAQVVGMDYAEALKMRNMVDPQVVQRCRRV